MKAYSFKHRNDTSLFAVSIIRNGANIPGGPWDFWREEDIDLTRAVDLHGVGFDLKEAIEALSTCGFYVRKETPET